MTNAEELKALAILTGIKKAIDKELDGKVEGSLRQRVDEKLKAEYFESGTDRKRLPVDGTKPSYLSLVFSQGGTTYDAYVDKPGEFADWLVGAGRRHFLGWLISTQSQALVKHMLMKLDTEITGEVPDGITVYETHEDKHIKGTVLKGCEAQDVFKTFEGELSALAYYTKDIPLLGGGE